MRTLLCVVAMAGLSACASHTPRLSARLPDHTTAAGPRFTLSVAPRLVLLTPLGHTPIRLRVRIDNAGPDWYCPHIRVEWAQGQAFERESDCTPWESMSAAEQAAPVFLPWSSPATACCYPPGTHAIRVILSQGVRRRILTDTVTVAGGE